MRSANDKVLASGGLDVSVRTWDIAGAFEAASSRNDEHFRIKPKHTFRTKGTGVSQVQWTRHNMLFASGGFDLGV